MRRATGAQSACRKAVYNNAMDEAGRIPIFVINLARSAERRAHMEFQLHKLRLPFRIFPATDGRALSDAIVQAAARGRDPGLYRKPFTVGEVGCALSQLRVYETVVSENLPYALILEDDVFIEPRAAQLMHARVLEGMPQGWDMLLCAFVQRGNLYSKPYKNASLRFAGRFTLRGLEGSRFTAGIPTEFCYHTAGYIVSRSGAEKLLEAGTPLRMPADILTGNARLFGLQSYALKTPCIRQHGTIAKNSTIKIADQAPADSFTGSLAALKAAAKTNALLFAPLTLAMRALLLCKNAAMASARGFIFPVRLLRKLGLVPLDCIKPAAKPARKSPR